MPKVRDDSFYEIESVSKALSILEVVVEDGPLVESRVVAKTQLSRDTVLRSLRTLRLRGYLRRDESTGKWTIGPRLVRLAGDARC